jgi:hypothetical protein
MAKSLRNSMILNISRINEANKKISVKLEVSMLN